MIAKFKPFGLSGEIDAPPSKSLAHRYLISAALSKKPSVISGISYSEDILATLDCLKALGVKITTENDKVSLFSENFMKAENPVLNCRESGSTLRFFIPITLTLGKNVTFSGSRRLFERPLEIYQNLCREKGFLFKKSDNSLTVCGELKSGSYTVSGGVSSQFITGLIFALVLSGEDSHITVLPPFESKPYVYLTLSALKSFGANVYFSDEYNIEIKASSLSSFSGKIEGDFSNAAFLDAFNYLNSNVKINNLNPESLQGDKIYSEYFKKISAGSPTLDISDCPDLAPVLFALAALKNGAVFMGTNRLKAKESDRGASMHEELKKLGGGIIFGENSITVPKQELKYQNITLNGHNDHRIVMALAVILSQTGGVIEGVEAVNKSYPDFFENIQYLGAKVEIL